MDGISSGPQSSHHPERPVNDRSSGRREGMAQNGGTRGGIVHDQVDRDRANQNCCNVSNTMSERVVEEQVIALVCSQQLDKP